MENKKNLSAGCIIPVFNEARTIAGVLEAVLQSNLFNDVVMVNDGSTDESLKIGQKFKPQIKIVNLVKNMGKGCALSRGIKKTKTDLVVFIDADAVNLSRRHLKLILSPFSNPKVCGVVGFGKLIINNPAFLQGDRAYRRQLLLPYLKQMEKTRFGIELFLETLAKQKKWHCRHVQLTGIKKLLKFDKTGFSTQTLKAYLAEVAEIVNQASRDKTKTAREIYTFQKNITAWMIKDYLKIPKKMLGSITKQSKKLKVLTKFLDNL